MKQKTGTRFYLPVYFIVGTAVGGYLIYLLAAEFGSAAVRDDIARTLPAALMVVAYFVAPLYAAAQSWRLLFPDGRAPPLRSSMVLTWVGLSVNWLLPVALVGGELVKLRLALRRSSGIEHLVASLVGDKTIQVATQLLYTLLGLSVLAWTGDRVTGGVREAAGLLLFCAAVYLFYRLQRAGMFARAARRLRTLIRDRERVEVKAGLVDAAVDDMYRRAGRWWHAVAWRMSFRFLMAVEVGLVLWWLGEPVPFWAVVALESVAQASRVAALVIPAALGAQEAVIVAAGLLLGYPVDALLALAVVKRIRELAVGGTGLVVWQLYEARALVRGEN